MNPNCEPAGICAKRILCQRCRCCILHCECLSFAMKNATTIQQAVAVAMLGLFDFEEEKK